MTAKILNGSGLAKTIQAELKQEIVQLAQQAARPPGLAVVLVGENPASQIYINHKRRACENVGIRSFAYKLAEDTSQTALFELIDELNENNDVDGILVQLPLPQQIDAEAILERIATTKDVDGFHPYNLGRLAQRLPLMRPCTAYGIITLLERNQIQLAGLNAILIGASRIVGRPTALELLLRDASVSVCHKLTKDLRQYVNLADLLIVATGQRHVVPAEWIKPGTIVVDVGIHRLDDGSICGDLDYDSFAQRASWITPVPGGVGPMTVTMLLHNTVFAFRQALK